MSLPLRLAHLGQVPGAYINLGNGDSALALYARLVERELPKGI